MFAVLGNATSTNNATLTQNATVVKNETLLTFSPDTNFTAISDLSGKDELYADPDGNLYYTNPGTGTEFAINTGFVEGTVDGRFFHYYTDTMKAYNVSRFRLSDEEHIPVAADFVTLGPINLDSNSKTQDIYIAADTVGGIYFPVTCVMYISEPFYPLP